MATISTPPERASRVRNPRLLRDAQAGALVEAFVVIGILTILVTRAYLHATGYPQIGGSTLHIAHALWGGLGMVVALVVVFSFLGALPRMVAVVAGGIGFGLFLDEVGKFVTQTNDYFFQPSVAIMYVVVVALLLVNRWIHDNRTQSSAEDLANAAGTAADGLIHGLTGAAALLLLLPAASPRSVSRGRGGSCGGLRRRASTRARSRASRTCCRGARRAATGGSTPPERGCACTSPECSTARARCRSRRSL